MKSSIYSFYKYMKSSIYTILCIISKSHIIYNIITCNLSV
ncbi:hypothetical protein F383_17316 [Gossypium arboreum]|uniref:Uncharacterized protein n=1 Tax=Gossypium arboreum TaxID=29729 RepID=A0A0B0NIN5_GOSAR|nr:hypothetical protein F383_17316 [Gossypium arboreum]